MVATECPVCGKAGKITANRISGGRVWRRRACECGYIWSTYEITAKEYNKMEKRSRLVEKILEEV